MKYYFTLVKITIIKKMKDNKCQGRCMEKKTLVLCCWHNNLVQLLWETTYGFLRRLKIELPHDLLLVICKQCCWYQCFEETVALSYRLIIISDNKDMEMEVYIHRWLNKNFWHICPRECYSAFPKQKTLLNAQFQ